MFKTIGGDRAIPFEAVLQVGQQTGRPVDGAQPQPSVDVGAPPWLWAAGVILIVLVTVYRVRRERRIRASQRKQAKAGGQSERGES